MYHFETDGDLDDLIDKPYAGWCFFGKWNVAWDNEYIERLSEDLSDDIADLRSGVNWEFTAIPTSKSGGTYAKVSVKVKLTSKRLLQTSNASSCGQSLHVGPGMHGFASG